MTTRQRDSHVSLTRAAILLVHHAKSDLPTTDRRPSSNLRKAKFLIRQFPSPNSTYFCLSPRSREKQFSTTDIDQSSPSQRIVIRNNISRNNVFLSLFDSSPVFFDSWTPKTDTRTKSMYTSRGGEWRESPIRIKKKMIRSRMQMESDEASRRGEWRFWVNRGEKRNTIARF